MVWNLNMMDDVIYTVCPECDNPAEVVDRQTVNSSDGIGVLTKVRCILGHWFLF